MKERLKILMLEDSDVDTEIVQRLLVKEKPHCKFMVVMTKEAYLKALEQFEPDLILSDNSMPEFNATEALEIARQRSLHIPFILVTGTVSEEFAASIIKLGADDYILKDRMVRLPAAIDAALQKKQAESAVRHSEEIRELIISSALDAVICVDTSGAITVENPRAAKLFGWGEKEILGKQFIETIIPERYIDRNVKEFIHFFKNGNGIKLGQVNEITVMDRMRNEFPVELTMVHVKQNAADFFCAFIRDISERKKAEDLLKLLEKKILEQKIQEQKRIARAIIKAQEKERNHLGQELHDNVCQILAGTRLYLGIAGKEDVRLKELLKYPMELLDSSINEIRLLSSQEVTPLKNIDLEELIETLLNKLKENTNIRTDFTCKVLNELISDDIKLNIYRITQEQVNNIIKHADASEVSIMIEADNNTVNITVMDDGKGFDVDKKRKGIGISNIINRVESYNGKVHIKSSPGNGCKIRVTIPY